MTSRFKNNYKLNGPDIGPNMSAVAWIEGSAEWINKLVCHGWKLYYVNFMFKPLRVPTFEIMPCMRKAIHKFYGRFCTEFVRDGRAPSAQDKLPRLWLFPDLPVFKYKKNSLDENTINGNGLHFNGPMLIPPRSSFNECPIKYLEREQGTYARHGIERIHIKQGGITGNGILGLAEYAAKTIKNGCADEIDIIVLPRLVKELTAKKQVVFDPKERLVKDIQSRFNVSDDIARQMRDDIVEAGIS